MLSLDPSPMAPSDPLWRDHALDHLDQLLDDHAQCELKAASNALALVGRHPEKDALARALSALATEEMRHYRLVRRVLRRRGAVPGLPRRSPYVAGLMTDRRGGKHALLEELVIAGVIEARSCERFERLAEGLRERAQAPLAALYERLIRSEAGHARLFTDLAGRYFAGEEVAEEWQRRLALEAQVLTDIPLSPRMHGGYRVR